jgi:hypothetical protein
VDWGVNESLTLDVVALGSCLWTDGRGASGRLPFARRSCDTASHMEMNLTLGLTAGLLALAVFAGWRGAQPPNPHKGPRLVPWRFIMLAAAAGLVPLLGHLAQLAGLTGTDR